MASTSPTPREIKSLAAHHGYVERRQEASKTLFFKKQKSREEGEDSPTLVNVFYTTRAVMTLLSHPRKGYNSLWRGNAYDSLEDLADLFDNPRMHTGRGYRNADSAIRACPSCGLEKKRIDFSKNQWSKGPDTNKCKECVAKGQQQTLEPPTTVSQMPSLDDLRIFICCDAPGCPKTKPALQCEQCLVAYYCSPQCQSKHAREHQTECFPIDLMRTRHAASLPPDKNNMRCFAMTGQLVGKSTFEAILNQAEYIYQEDGEWDTAIALYRQLLIRDQEAGTPPQWRRVWMGFSRCFYEIGEYDKAIQAGSAAVETNRIFPQVYKYIALAEKAAGNYEAAKATIAKALLYEAPWDDENRRLNEDLFRRIFGLSDHSPNLR